MDEIELKSTLEIKQWWMYNEWSEFCQFSKFIREAFPNREELHPMYKNPDVEKILSIFHEVRGKWLLWQEPRETATWTKIETQNLTLQWIDENVEVLYPSDSKFEVTCLNGIVLWDAGQNLNNQTKKRFELYEGNHRVSAWKFNRLPLTLPTILYIGRPKN